MDVTKETNQYLRPMMKISEMVPYLKEKNIKFEKMSEKDAEKYLRYNNNYYNVTAYKHNFERYVIDGKFVDKFIDLDFAYLKDLAIIDHRTRLVLFKMTIDIEHYLKIRILNLIEDIEQEDGYRIVNMSLEKDFNDEKEPLDNFVVGLMDKKMVESGIEMMSENLDKSNIILAVECKEDVKFRYSCATQKVEVKKIFKGNNINIGKEIEICTVKYLFMNKNMQVEGKQCANMGFVNKMEKGKTYLVFLDKRAKNTNIYVTQDDIFIKTIFSYENIKNNECIPISKEQYSIKYADAKNNEFFITSEKGIKAMEKYKQSLIQKYNYN